MKRFFRINLSISIIILAVFLIIGCDDIFNSKTEHDIKDKTNDAMIVMVDNAIAKQIKEHTKSTFNPGFVAGSRERVIKFLNSITKLETYARQGVMSSQSRNRIMLKIKFVTDLEVKDIYTSLSTNAYIGPKLLVDISLKRGKTIAVLTNGAEFNGPPEAVIPDLNAIIDAAISYDISLNRNAYFPPTPTAEEYKKQWENQ